MLVVVLMLETVVVPPQHLLQLAMYLMSIEEVETILMEKSNYHAARRGSISCPTHRPSPRKVSS